MSASALSFTASAPGASCPGLSSPDALSQPDKAGHAEHTAMIANAFVVLEMIRFISSAPGPRPISIEGALLTRSQGAYPFAGRQREPLVFPSTEELRENRSRAPAECVDFQIDLRRCAICHPRI